MSRDPWAEDWEDDWTKASQAKASSSQIWSQANATSSPAIDLAHVAPQVAYKGPMKILKRETAPDGDSTTSRRPEASQPLDQVAREARYREARERLFGSPSISPAPNGRPVTLHATSDSDSVKPARQARGPEANARGGFARRGRGQKAG